MASWKAGGGGAGGDVVSWEQWGERGGGGSAALAARRSAAHRDRKPAASTAASAARWKAWGEKFGTFLVAGPADRESTTCGWSWRGEDVDNEQSHIPSVRSMSDEERAQLIQLLSKLSGSVD